MKPAIYLTTCTYLCAPSTAFGQKGDENNADNLTTDIFFIESGEGQKIDGTSKR